MKLIVLGAGMQGVTAAYDAAKFGPFTEIILADLNLERADAGVGRVNRLIGRDAIRSAAVDAADPPAVRFALRQADLAILALPYSMHPGVETAAIEVGCSVVDMGQDTNMALATHQRSDAAEAKGISVVTDCGLAPGLVNLLAAELLNRGETESIRASCGGLPESPIPPLGYAVRFSIDSVIGEYSEPVLSLRNGRVVEEAPLGHREDVDFPPMGSLEAFTTSGGTGTAPYAFAGRLQNYEYMTLRYPGHLQAMRLFQAVGLWSEALLPGLGCSPRQAFTATLQESLAFPDIADVVLVRVESSTTRFEIFERSDPITGFSAMERLTGFCTAIAAIEIATGKVPPGCWGCETALNPARFLGQLERRGISVRETQSEACVAEAGMPPPN